MKNKTILFTSLVALSMMISSAHTMYQPEGDITYDSSMNASASAYTFLDTNQTTYTEAVSDSYSDAYSNSNAYGTGVGYGGSSSNDIRNTNRATGGAGGSSDATAYGGSQSQGQGQTATTGNNTTAITSNNIEATNKTITYDKKGYDLPPAPPAISPTVIGQMGTTTYSGAISTPFGGVSGGFSKTNKEGKDLMKAQAEALRVQADTMQVMTEAQVINADIQNLKDADTLPEADRAIIKEFILNKYRY